MENDFTEASLASAIAEMKRMGAVQPISLRPTKIILRPNDIQRIADYHGVTYEEAYARIKAQVSEVDDE